MGIIYDLIREIKFAARDRSVIIWIMIVLSLSTAAVSFGLLEVKHQHSEIDYLIQVDQEERIHSSKKLKDWGSAAYYNFHLTYDRPSEFAFAAMGQRDLQPWKHRIRMLAIEGQIYERDSGNPVIALIGRFDFAFLAAFILPIVLIILLYDLRANERIAGRHNLLVTTVGGIASLWLPRAFVRVAAIVLSLYVPFLLACVVSGVSISKLLLATLYLLLYSGFWSVLCYFLSAWRKPSSLILMSLMGLWLSLAVVLPSLARLAIDRVVQIPSSADILLLQREAVNDAWDLPREQTMDAFFERYPEWSNYVPVDSAFEWQWYYAFQQVGDQRTELLTDAYNDGRKQRDYLATWASIVALPSLLERSLQRLAETDQKSIFSYEENVRNFHAELRTYYYARLFKNQKFEKSDLLNLPQFGLE